MGFRLDTSYGDYDTKRHVDNAVYVTYLETARVRAWLDADVRAGLAGV